MATHTLTRLQLIDKAWQLLVLDMAYEPPSHIFWHNVSEDIQNMYLAKVKEL